MEDYMDYINEDTDLSIVNEFIDGIDLFPKQLKALKDSMLSSHRSGIWTIEMGLGKTIITLGVLTLLLPKLKDKLAIVVAPSVTVESFYDHISDRTLVYTGYSTGKTKEVKGIINLIEQGAINCLVCTESIWSNLEFTLYIYNNIDKVCCMIFDEFSLTEDNNAGNNFVEFARNVPFTFIANATPIKRSPYTLYSILRGVRATDLNFRKFKRAYYNYSNISGKSYYTLKSEELLRDVGDHIINFNREDVNAETTYKEFKFLPVYPTATQRKLLENGVPKLDVLYNTPGVQPLDIPAFKAYMTELLSVPADDNKITFCAHHKSRDMVTKVVKAMGIPVMHIDGDVTDAPEKKLAIEKLFNESTGINLTTSIDVGSNLKSAKEVFIYETPDSIAQYIGRAARGFDPKEVSVFWIYYPDYELDSLFKAALDIRDNDKLTKRNGPVYNFIKDEILRVAPNDPRVQLLT